MICAENVSFVYQEGMPLQRQALHNINITIPDGDFAAIIGHTGSGKSTLIQLFNGLLKPSSGKIIIDGEDIFDKKTNIRDIRRKVGLVFQYPEHQLFEETVFDDIAYGPKNMGFSAEEIKEKVYHAAQLVGISEKYMKKSPFELSGGQKRRVAIAGVLAMDPKVLILDEPAAGLDPKGRDSILSMLKKLHEQDSTKTIIFVSHSMEDVAKVAKNIYVMNKGTLAMSGTVSEIFSKSRELTEIGLSVPEITLISDKLREKGFNIPQDIYTVKYAAQEILKLIKGGGGNV